MRRFYKARTKKMKGNCHKELEEFVAKVLQDAKIVIPSDAENDTKGEERSKRIANKREKKFLDSLKGIEKASTSKALNRKDGFFGRKITYIDCLWANSLCKSHKWFFEAKYGHDNTSVAEFKNAIFQTLEFGLCSKQRHLSLLLIDSRSEAANFEKLKSNIPGVGFVDFFNRIHRFAFENFNINLWCVYGCRASNDEHKLRWRIFPNSR